MVGLYNRRMSYLKAKRKRRIDKETTPYWGIDGLYKNLHQYSKNKIHCSCPWCSAKTRNKGKVRQRDGNYSRSLNYSVSDKRKIDKVEYIEEDEED